MTLIAAWKDKRNIFVVGDSAITRRNVSNQYVENILNKKKLTTTFGESLVVNTQKVVSEEVIKIHNVNDKLIVGFAGYGNNAVDLIEFLIEELDTSYTISFLCYKILEGADIYGSPYEMVFGVMSGKNPVLFTFNTEKKRKFQFYGIYTPVMLGNMKNEPIFKLITDSLVDMLKVIRFNNSPDKKLIMACGLLQGLTIRAGFIVNGVGGFYTGGYLNRKGFHWEKDLAFIKFDINLSQIGITDDPQIIYPNAQLICIINREGKIATMSFDIKNNYRNIRVFQNYINEYTLKLKSVELEEDFNKWKLRNEEDIVNTLENFEFDFLMFLCTDIDAPNKMTIIEKESIIDAKYMKIKWKNGIPIINISKQFSKEINPMYAEYLNQFHWMPVK